MQWQKHELSYCSNVHPGASLLAVKETIATHISSVAAKRGLPNMAAGCWFSAECIEAISSNPDEREQLLQLLDQSGLYLGTLNGFPFGDFHQPVVKQKVYQPTWAEQARLDYTVALAELLAKAPYPANTLQEKSISTLPLAYAADWDEHRHQQACENLCLLALKLEQIHRETGTHVRVCIEMEPDCVLESTTQFIHFFQHDLTAHAHKMALPEELIYRYLGCCYDTCHQAVMGESIELSLTAILDAGIHIGKIQISSAPRVFIRSKEDIGLLCKTFEEPKFLHQVKIGPGSALVRVFADLCKDQINQSANEPGFSQLLDTEWRIHFHVPVDMESMVIDALPEAVAQDALVVQTTRNEIEHLLTYLKTDAHRFSVKPFLEIETYTWQQFNTAHDFDLQEAIVKEINWLECKMASLDLLSA